MDETFEIPVTYQNRDICIPARLLLQGYTYKIEVCIDGVVLYFEPDEERNFRSVLPPELNQENAKLPDVALLQIVSDTLSAAMK